MLANPSSSWYFLLSVILYTGNKAQEYSDPGNKTHQYFKDNGNETHIYSDDTGNKTHNPGNETRIYYEDPGNKTHDSSNETYDKISLDNIRPNLLGYNEKRPALPGCPADKVCVRKCCPVGEVRPVCNDLTYR